ncbi:hypothetical protein Hanom_Chr11g01011641 [Helianthus anomalus]
MDLGVGMNSFIYIYVCIAVCVGVRGVETVAGETEKPGLARRRRGGGGECMGK